MEWDWIKGHGEVNRGGQLDLLNNEMKLHTVDQFLEAWNVDPANFAPQSCMRI